MTRWRARAVANHEASTFVAIFQVVSMALLALDWYDDRLDAASGWVPALPRWSFPASPAEPASRFAGISTVAAALRWRG